MGRFVELVAVVTLTTIGCGAEVTVEQGAGANPVEQPDEDDWSLCTDVWSPSKPPDAGNCAGQVPLGEPDAEQAGQIFGRMIHEADHIASVLRGGEVRPYELDGDRIVATLDVGWVDGLVNHDGACASVVFACWTGGHGGFGPSALDGEMQILVERDIALVRGTLGLSEGGALVGAPEASVRARLDDATATGSVGSFEF